MWGYERTHSRVGANGCQWLQGLHTAISPVADLSDVSSRRHMIDTLTIYKLLAPHGTKERNCTKLSSGSRQPSHCGT